MDRVVILDVGVEGGGTTIYGRCEAGGWVFWQEGSAMSLDDNDDEEWHNWSGEPVSELRAALPDEWYRMYPIEIHPEFKALIRTEFVRRTSGLVGEDGRAHRFFNREAWEDALG